MRAENSMVFCIGNGLINFTLLSFSFLAIVLERLKSANALKNKTIECLGQLTDMF